MDGSVALGVTSTPGIHNWLVVSTYLPTIVGNILLIMVNMNGYYMVNDG